MYTLETKREGGTSGSQRAVKACSLLDCISLQDIMDGLHSITGYSMAIIDLHGEVLVKTGWQTICEFFHRKNKLCLQNCRESDVSFVKNIPPNEFKLYRCKNNLWDTVTPLFVGGQHLANLFFGQFLFEEQETDLELFTQKAREYGFNETDYLSALAEVPRYSYEKVAKIMNFLSKFATLISNNNHQRMMANMHFKQREDLLNTLRFHSLVLESIADSVSVTDLHGKILYVNNAECEATGYRREELIGKHISHFGNDESSAITQAEILQNTIKHGSFECVLRNRGKNGRLRNLKLKTQTIFDAHNKAIALCATAWETDD